MSIQVNEPITTREGTELTSFYVRVEPRLRACGCKVDVEAAYYVSKEAFKAGAAPIRCSTYSEFDYDRSADGTDLLTFANDCLLVVLRATGIPGRGYFEGLENCTITDLD